MRTRTMAVIVASAAAGAVGATVASAAGDQSGGAAQAAQQRENRVLFAVMTGRKEVDANGRRGAGDPDGRGSFTAIVDDGRLCYGLTVKNIDAPVGAHIHKARPNRNGPVVVPLTQPSSGDPGASSGCVNVDADLARAILKRPHAYYVNVHTAAFPGGAVRGQLFRHTHR